MGRKRGNQIMAQLQGASLLRQIRKVVAAQCPSRQSDAHLVQHFLASRDEAAFVALTQRHGSMVLGVCRNVLHHQQDAEDVFQAVFLVLARKAHTIRKHQSLSSWLHGVAYRLALKAKARRNRRLHLEHAMANQLPTSMANDITVRELGVILHAELQRLPEAFRAPLLLSYWEGKTRDEAADQLGMTANTFKKRLERARNLLGARLARRGIAPSVAMLAMLLSDNGVKAAISSVLIQNTAKAALAYAAGTLATGGATASALALAEGAIRAMTMTKWVTTILLTVFLSGLGTSLGMTGYQALHGQHSSAPVLTVASEGQLPAQEKPKAVVAQKTDAERFVGTWRITKSLLDGKEMPPEIGKLARFTFSKDGKVSMQVLDNGSEGTYTLVGPGKIDVAFDAAKPINVGIYKFDGDDRITLCIPKEEQVKKRPTEFTGEKDSGQVLLTLTRAKPGEEQPSAEEIAKYADPVTKMRLAASRQISANNLKQIGLAMHNYHDANLSLPSHAIYSKDGKTPLLSWRVAILPFIAEEPLYKEFKLDEPWDSAHNKKLIVRMPKTYEINMGKKGEGLTYYQVFTGTGTLFDGTKKMKFQDIGNGTSNTLLAVEARDPVVWTKPSDLTLPKDKDKLPPLGGLFKNGFHVLMCDGSVRMLPPDPAPKLLRGAISPKGGD